MKRLTSFFALAAAVLMSVNVMAAYQAAVVAGTDTTQYSTLNAAFADANDGETVLLLMDINGGSTITLDSKRTLTLNLNGKTWNFNDGDFALSLGIDLQAGELTVKGYGAMQDTLTSAKFFKTAADTKLTIVNGNFTNQGVNAGVESYGDLTIKSAWVNFIHAEAGKVTINGAHINTKIIVSYDAEAVILGGEINRIAGEGTYTVKAGKVTTVASLGANLFVGGTIASIEDGKNTIEGGKFTVLNAQVVYDLKGGVYASDTLSDGAKIDSLVAEGYSVKPNEDATYKFQVSKDLIKIVETGVAYGTIGEALAAAQDGETVQLQDDIELGGNLNVYLAGAVTLDMNGKTWSLSNDKEAQQGGMRVYKGELTVKNGSVAYNDALGGCVFFDMKDSTKLTIKDVVFSGNDYCYITCNGEMVFDGGELRSLTLGDKATALTIDGGKITGQISLASNPETRCQVVINDGEIENICTMNANIRGTFVNVNGGEITWLQNGDSTFIGGGAIENINGGLNVIIGGEFTSLYFANNTEEEGLHYRAGTYDIYGGVFATENYVTDGAARGIEAAPGYGVFASEEPAYPFEVKKIETAKPAVQEQEAKDLAEQNSDIAIKSGIQEATVGYKDSCAKYLVIVMDNAVVEEGNVETVTYDVKPQYTYTDAEGVHNEIIPNSEIQDSLIFRLAVDKKYADQEVYVYHKSNEAAEYKFFVARTVQNEGEAYFVELKAKEFSLFQIRKDAPAAIAIVKDGAEQNGKMLKNGQLFIVKDGKVYNALGTQL